MPLPKENSIGYLISRYPAVSHTFIQREISSLRKLGFSIKTASINFHDISTENLSTQDEEDISATFYVKKKGIVKAFFALFKAFSKSPFRFCKAFRHAFTLGQWDLKQKVYNLFYFAEAALVGAWMEDNGITHLHVHFANPAATVALLAARLYPFTFSMMVHGPDDFYEITLNLIKEKIEEAAFVFCISFYTQSQLMRISSPSNWSKFHVTRLGVDPALYAPVIRSLKEDQIKLLCIGRLAPSKGQLILLETLLTLKGFVPSLRLELVGEGPDRAQLMQFVKANGLGEQVIFRGALNQRQTHLALSSSDIFILSSFAEGLPVALMEAMAMEIPCIASGINGIPELIKNDKQGLLIAPSDKEGLANAIAYLCKHPEVRKEIGQNARKEIVKNYNLAINSQNLAETWKKCLEATQMEII